MKLEAGKEMDRKSVMAWLEGLAQDDWRMFHSDSDVQEIALSALAMLKEQEAKPMIENERGWNCPSCGMALIGKTASGYPCDLIDLPEDEPIHFCPMCGQAVKWDG